MTAQILTPYTFTIFLVGLIAAIFIVLIIFKIARKNIEFRLHQDPDALGFLPSAQKRIQEKYKPEIIIVDDKK